MTSPHAVAGLLELPEQEQRSVTAAATAALADFATNGGEVVVLGRFPRGLSNDTILLQCGSQRLVLRRPPVGAAAGTHDLLREARIMQGLSRSDVPVPEVITTVDDAAILATPFVINRLVDGIEIAYARPPFVAADQFGVRIARNAVEMLVRIHAVDLDAVGLADLGHPQGYLERQIRRFTSLWQVNRTREIPLLIEVSRRLRESMPDTSDHTLVHGDYTLANLLAQHDPALPIAAVVDWELSTLGDPLADLGYLVASWVLPDDPVRSILHARSVTLIEPFPPSDQLVRQYGDLSGRDTSQVDWYVALALWKDAVIMEGNYKLWLDGRSTNQALAVLDDGVPQLVASAAARLDQLA